CSVCKQSGWIEILGAGMVHPDVLSMDGYDPNIYSGFAFGMGQDRIAMLKYGIEDIRNFYLDDIRVLQQFHEAQGGGIHLFGSLNCVNNSVDYGDQTPEVLAEQITKAGIEVDGIEYIVSEKSTNVVVGYVQECEQHPNADKLKLCHVDVGESEPLQIICGAP